MSKLTPEILSTILFATADFHNQIEKLWKRAPKVRLSNLLFFSDCVGPILKCSSNQQETKNNGLGLLFHGPTRLKPEKNVDWIRNCTF